MKGTESSCCVVSGSGSDGSVWDYGRSRTGSKHSS